MGCLDLSANEIQASACYMVIEWFWFSKNTCLNLLGSISNFTAGNICLLFLKYYSK